MEDRWMDSEWMDEWMDGRWVDNVWRDGGWMGGWMYLLGLGGWNWVEALYLPPRLCLLPGQVRCSLESLFTKLKAPVFT